MAVLSVVVGLECGGCSLAAIGLMGGDFEVAMEYVDHVGTTLKPAPRRRHPRNSIGVYYNRYSLRL